MFSIWETTLRRFSLVFRLPLLGPRLEECGFRKDDFERLPL